MWRLLVGMKHSLGWHRKSSKIVDESSIGGGEVNGLIGLQEHNQEVRHGRFAALLAVVRLPLVALSCFAGHVGDGTGEFWTSGELPRASDMDYLMVRDSMRYAIYV